MAWLSRLGRRGDGRRSGEELGDDPFGEIVVQRSPADAQAVPDQRGTDVGEQGHVGVGRDLASGHATGQHLADGGLPVAEEGGPEGLGQHRMASLLGDQRLHQVASRLDHVRGSRAASRPGRARTLPVSGDASWSPPLRRKASMTRSALLSHRR